MAINDRYASGCGVCLGVFHIIFGVASCGSGIAAFVYSVYLHHIGVAIWAGALFILTGVLGLVSGSRNNAVIAAYYAFSLISVFVSMGQMAVFSYATYIELVTCDRDFSYVSYYPGFDDYCPIIIQSLVVCGGALLAGFLEWIMAMASSCASCSCCCSSQRPEPAQTVLVHNMQPMYQAPQQVPMHQAPQQVYVGQPGCSMPPPGPAYKGNPQAPDSQFVYVNAPVDLGPEAERDAYLPNMTSVAISKPFPQSY